VQQAESAEVALERLENTTFDLVISDVKMPGLDGIALLGRIKEHSPDTAVLMMTAFSTAEQAVEAMKLGAYDYIASRSRWKRSRCWCATPWKSAT